MFPGRDAPLGRPDALNEGRERCGGFEPAYHAFVRTNVGLEQASNKGGDFALDGHPFNLDRSWDDLRWPRWVRSLLCDDIGATPGVPQIADGGPHCASRQPGQKRTFASIANSVPWRSPGVLFGVLSRWTITRLLGGPNHRLDANLHIKLRWFARFETLMRMAVRPRRAVPTHPADAPYGGRILRVFVRRSPAMRSRGRAPRSWKPT